MQGAPASSSQWVIYACIFTILQIDKNNPEFATTYESTEQMIKVHFTTLEVVAHCEAILDITEFADSLVASLDQGKAPAAPAEDGQAEDEGYISEDDKKPERKLGLWGQERERERERGCSAL